MERETLELIGGESDGRLIESDQPSRVLRVPIAAPHPTVVPWGDEVPPDSTFDYDEYEYRGRNDRGHVRMVKR